MQQKNKKSAEARREAKRVYAAKYRKENAEKLRAYRKANRARHREYERAYHRRNKQKRKAKGAKYRETQREKITRKQREKRKTLQQKNKIRLYSIKQNYGLTQKHYESLLVAQNNICAICPSVLGEKPHIDHCHETNKIRGLLCRHCNIGLGNFKDNITRLESAIAYLKRSKI